MQWIEIFQLIFFNAGESDYGSTIMKRLRRFGLSVDNYNLYNFSNNIFSKYNLHPIRQFVLICVIRGEKSPVHHLH